VDSTSQNDRQLLDEILGAAGPRIEIAVNAFVQRAVDPGTLVAVVERTFGGEILVGCGPRASLAARLVRVAGMSAESRHALSELASAASSTELPVVVLAHCEGYVAAGMRRLTGGLSSLS
jgi:delta 1-pyrroline-5-carboxylate dehydrogenase